MSKYHIVGNHMSRLICILASMCNLDCHLVSLPLFAMVGADPGFLESGFICIKEGGVRIAGFISFFLNIP